MLTLPVPTPSTRTNNERPAPSVIETAAPMPPAVLPSPKSEAGSSVSRTFPLASSRSSEMSRLGLTGAAEAVTATGPVHVPRAKTSLSAREVISAPALGTLEAAVATVLPASSATSESPPAKVLGLVSVISARSSWPGRVALE